MLFQALDSLAVRWLGLAGVFFATFCILMDVFVFDVPISLIMQGAVVFAAVSSTICVLLMRSRDTHTFSYADAMFSSGVAAVLLIGLVPSYGLYSDHVSLPSLILLALGVLAGVAGKWVYGVMLTSVRGWIRTHAAKDS